MTDPTPRVRHVALTGGPCAGKSSAMAMLRRELQSRGWAVLVAPEAASLVIDAGLGNPAELAAADPDAYQAAQRTIVGVQLALHRQLEALAQALAVDKAVVLHDRGLPDNLAYANPVDYAGTLAAHGLDHKAALALYDTVVHLRSASRPGAGYDGSSYTTANNAARHEDALAAATLDEATLSAWAHHPHLNVVAAQSDFAGKLARVLAAVLTVLGDPDPVEHERKFLLESAPDLTHPELAAAVVVGLEQVYLPDAVGGGEQRVRARTVDGATTYTHTVKRPVPGSTSRVELEREIDAQTFDVLAGMRAEGSSVLRKTRRVFVHDDQRFELDEIHEPVHAWLLEAEVAQEHDPVQVPEFLGAASDVTADPSWRNGTLARS